MLFQHLLIMFAKRHKYTLLIDYQEYSNPLL